MSTEIAGVNSKDSDWGLSLDYEQLFKFPIKDSIDEASTFARQDLAVGVGLRGKVGVHYKLNDYDCDGGSPAVSVSAGPQFTHTIYHAGPKTGEDGNIAEAVGGYVGLDVAFTPRHCQRYDFRGLPEKSLGRWGFKMNLSTEHEVTGPLSGRQNLALQMSVEYGTPVINIGPILGITGTFGEGAQLMGGIGFSSPIFDLD